MKGSRTCLILLFSFTFFAQQPTWAQTPASPAITQESADRHLQRGEFRQALEAYATLDRQAPSAANKIGLAKSYDKLGLPRKAREVLTSYLNSMAAPSNFAWNNADGPDKPQVFDLKTHKQDKAAVALELANIHLALGSLNDATTAIHQAENALSGQETTALTAQLIYAKALLRKQQPGQEEPRDPGQLSQSFLDAAQWAKRAHLPALQWQATLHAAHLSTDEKVRSTLLHRLAPSIHRLPTTYDSALVLLHFAGLANSSLPTQALSAKGPGTGGPSAKQTPRALTPTTTMAYRALQQAQIIGASLENPRIQSLAYGLTANLYQDQGRHAEALRLYNTALFHSAVEQEPDLLYQWFWHKAQSLIAQQRMEEGKDALASAVVHLDRYRKARKSATISHNASQTGDDRLFHATQVLPVYFDYADLLLRLARQAPIERKQALLKDARGAIERSRTIELEDYFQDPCVSTSMGKKLRIEDLDPATAVIYPVILPDRLEILVSLHGKIQQITRPISQQHLYDEVEQFRRYLEKRTTRQYLPYAQKLYTTLLADAEPILAEHAITTLVVIPSGQLRLIPFAALHDGQHYLIERYALAVTPSLDLTDPKALHFQQQKVLLGGVSKSVQGFPPLPNVDQELAGIRQLFGGSLFQDDNFRLQPLTHEIQDNPYQVVHIASHGVFERNVENSFILSYDQKIHMTDLENLIAPKRYEAQAIELLTLSACQTAAGDEQAALGLAGVAVKAGARSALASLWFINDRSSAMLIADFYRGLQANTSKAQALQQAQQHMLEHPMYSHPAYWAPFLLIGNWL